MKINDCYFFLFFFTYSASAEVSSFDSSELVQLTSNMAKAHVNVSRKPLSYNDWVGKYTQSQSSAKKLYKLAESLTVAERNYNQYSAIKAEMMSNFSNSLRNGKLEDILQSMKEIVRADDLKKFNSCTLKDEINNITLLTRDIDPVFDSQLNEKCKNLSPPTIAYSSTSEIPTRAAGVAGVAGLAGLISLIPFTPILTPPESDDLDNLIESDNTPISR